MMVHVIVLKWETITAQWEMKARLYSMLNITLSSEVPENEATACAAWLLNQVVDSAQA